MSSEGNSHKKTSSGSRSLHRKLFSFDSQKRQASETSYVSDGTDTSVSEGQNRCGINARTLYRMEEDGEADLPLDGPVPAWSERVLTDSPVSSPSEEGSRLLVSSESAPDLRKKHVPKFRVHKPTNISIGSQQSSSDSQEPPPSPSRRRWDQVRQQLVPSVSIRHQQSSSSLGQSFAYGTPKASRLAARLGWGHTVERVQQVAADDAKRFEDEVRRACGAARSAEYAKLVRAERDALQANIPPPPLYKPFMSTTSLPFSANSSSASLPLAPGGRYGLRRPQSIQSLASVAAGPSLHDLRSLLLRYSSSESSSYALPLESEIISALLIPFLSPDTSASMEQERMNSVDAFEILVGTWPPSSAKSALERCLWCAKAGSAPPSRLRIRILSVLDRLVTGSQPLFPETALNLQTLLHALFSLLSSYGSDSAAAAEFKILRGFLSKIQDGKCCELLMQATEEEYQAISVKGEDESKAREAVFGGALVRCFENGSQDSRRWLLRNATEDFWLYSPTSLRLTPLLNKIYARNLEIFTHAAIALLAPSMSAISDFMRVDAETISRLLRTRVIPVMEVMQDQDSQAVRSTVARLVIALLAIDSTRKQARDYICEWYVPGSRWKTAIETAIKDLLTIRGWPTIGKTLDMLIKILPDDIRKAILTFFLPCLYDALAADSTPVTDPHLIQVLNDISRAYPQLFFKPVIMCAASSKDTTVIKQLRICAVLSSFVPEFFTRDSEMMSVALLSDVAGAKAVSNSKSSPRLGQLIILLELIARIRQASQNRDQMTSIDPTLSTLPKFVCGLDSQLGVVLEAKEQKSTLSAFHRMLLCVLFLEMRLFTRSLKHASWLSRVLSWTEEMYGGDDASEYQRAQEEAADTTERIQTLYQGLTNESTTIHKRRSQLALSTHLDAIAIAPSSHEASVHPHLFKSRGDLNGILLNTLQSALLKLLVTVSGLLRSDDFVRIGQVIWSRCLDDNDCKTIAPACFLAMQCAEKIESEFLSLVQDDLRSTDAHTRCSAVQKLSTLASWRFQILSQDHIADMNHRRAFKLARPPLLFVATDMGTSLFVHNEDSTEYVDSQGNILPSELRKRLADIGWAQDEKRTDEKVLWKKTPMSVLPNTFMDQSPSFTESLISAPSSPNLTPEASPRALSPSGSEDRFVRRPSNIRNVKRRPVFVHALVSVFPEVALLTFDSDIAVSSAARNFIADLMRDDPSLLCRPIFDAIARDEQDLSRAVRTLRTFAHVRKDLPPSLTHYVFNHLAGFLKHSARREEDDKPLMGFAYVLPVMSNLASQVSEISIREIRRAKVEPFLIPSGSLWFPTTSPDGPMFPRQLDQTENPFESLSSHLVWITMIRISQNLLFLDMLKKNPQDVQIIRKRLSRLVLPSRDGSAEAPRLDLADFIPRRSDGLGRFRLSFSNLNTALIGLSLLLSRSYLLLIRQIFLSMSRHLNDRNELSVYLDGLNRILLAHGDDVGIVSQAMITLLTATTRFQRMFQSGSGYTLFMPAVVKVYTESEQHQGIRACVEYAVNRFFALHGIAFIFQSMSIMAHIVNIPTIDASWTAKGVYLLFSSLKNGTLPSGHPESAGIHRVSKKQERDALLVNTAEEKPQTFLASIRRATGPMGESISIDLPEEYDGKRFELRDFALFFINFIAEQDATLLRAELFLRFLRLLTPYLYGGSKSAQIVLRDGVEHIGSILLTRAPGKAKVPDVTVLNPSGHGSVEVYSLESNFENTLMSKSTSPSNLYSMRLEYLSLVVALTQSGGKMSSAAELRVSDILATIVKDSTTADNIRISAFLKEYSKSMLVRQPALSPKEVTIFLDGLLPFVRENMHIIDCSGLLEALYDAMGDTALIQEISFWRVVREYCMAGLRHCEDAANKNSVFQVPIRLKVIQLLSHGLSLARFDAVAEVVQCRATPAFLAGIVLPLTLAIGTNTGTGAGSHLTEGWGHQSQTTAWVRLLSYILSVCDDTHRPVEIRRSPSVNPLERSKSQDGCDRKVDANRAAVLAMAIQTLKVIVSRADNELSASIPGVWQRIATTVKTLLSEGDAKFAVTTCSQDANASHVQSPRTSFILPSASFEQFGSPVALHRQQSGTSKHIQRPGLADYLLWSFLWWLQLQQGPLLLQLRLFMQEKLHAVDQALRSEDDSGRAGSNDHRRSSVFLKPRRGIISSIHSAPSSPEASPRLGPTSFPTRDSPATPVRASVQRMPGYSLAASPSGEGGGSSGLKIVHLGPVRRSITVNMERSFTQNSAAAPSLKASRLLSSAGVMRSSSLVKETYCRIRTVQRYVGYDLLIPLPSVWDEDDSARMSHTKSYILRSLIGESQDLLEDLCMQEQEGEDDIVMVDMEDTSI